MVVDHDDIYGGLFKNAGRRKNSPIVEWMAVMWPAVM
jgi:hypothetical protein